MPDLTKFRNSLSAQQKDFLRSAFRIVTSLLPHRHNLEMLAMKHGTDKWGHGFMEHYQRHFAAIRKKPLKVLEIGIGKPQDPAAGGGSLRMWQDYFPHATIFGLDIEDKSSHADKRIRILRGDQSDPAFLRSMVAEIGGVDVVIDDGSHVNDHVIASFQTLFPLLSSPGIYVIEDTQTAYWPHYGGNWNGRFTAATSLSMLKDLSDGLNYEFIPGREPGYLDRNITAISFYRNIVFVTKGENKHTMSTFTQRHVERAAKLS